MPLTEVDELFYEVNNVKLRSIIKGEPYKVFFRILIWNKCKIYICGGTDGVESKEKTQNSV